VPVSAARSARSGTTEGVKRPLPAEGKTIPPYAAIPDEDADKPYMAHLIRLAREIPVRLQRGAQITPAGDDRGVRGTP